MLSPGDKVALNAEVVRTHNSGGMATLRLENECSVLVPSRIAQRRVEHATIETKDVKTKSAETK